MLMNRCHPQNCQTAFIYFRLSQRGIEWKPLLKNAWSLVSAALKDVKYPVPEVKLAAVPVNEIAFLQPEEIIPFCESVKGRTYEIPCLLMLHGLRLSEVRGLNWKNVDLTNNTITIKESLVRGEDGNVTKNTNKNKSSSRIVPLTVVLPCRSALHSE